MQERAQRAGISVIEAMDNLTHMAELDVNSTPAAIQKERVELTEEQVSEQLLSLSWQNPEYAVYNRERVKETFHVILNYLKQLYTKDKGHLRDLQTQRGIQAIMILAKEAAEKMDQFTAFFKGEKEESITQIKEYQDLLHFYENKILQRFQLAPETGTSWHEEWAGHAEGELLDIQRQGLKDLETIRKDREYELFLIRKDDGRPFFSKDLLRRLRLVGEFDEAVWEKEGEDLFLKAKLAVDRERHLSAKEILHLAAPYIDDYYKEAFKHKDKEFIGAINKALMALMLAANSQNLMQNVKAKSSLHYYMDFQFYLRQALGSSEYRKMALHPSKPEEKLSVTLLHLSHTLSTCFFMRSVAQVEMMNFIHQLIEKIEVGSVATSPRHALTLWDTLAEEDHKLRAWLKAASHGPILKAIGLFRSENQLTGFDPLAQGNMPMQLYTLIGAEMHISCLKLPSPVRQEYINKATVVEEFCGFLNALDGQQKGQLHLLINLQDRTSWQEHARCIALEEIHKKNERPHSLVVVTIPKNTDFYWQSGDYTQLTGAAEFIAQFQEQLKSAEVCGFHLPSECKSQAFQRFSNEAMQVIHSLFFKGQSTLTHKNRLDFIEIFYLLLFLKLIEDCKPDSLSFTCKDAIDRGAVASAEFYCFLKLMNSLSPWSQEEKKFVQWLLYSSSLYLRERAVDFLYFSRMISAFNTLQETLEAQQEKAVQELSKLFHLPFFKDLKINSG